MSRLLIWTLLWTTLCACERDKPLAADLSGDGSSPGIIPGPGARDGAAETSIPGDAGDAGGSNVVDAGRAVFCSSVSDGDIANNIDINIVGSNETVPFTTRFAFAEWNRDCSATPTLLVGLGQESCSPGTGKQIVIGLNADQIGIGIMPGPNQINVPEFEDNIAVRLNDPDPLNGSVRGTCVNANGWVALPQLGTMTGDRIEAQFDLELTDCSTPQQIPPVRTTGRIAVQVPINYDQICQ